MEIVSGLPKDSIHVIGWAAENSESGPPCYATFAWETQGIRHTARFKFWPRSPARLATANDEANDMANAVNMIGINGALVPLVPQLNVAASMRFTSGNYSEDVYVNPRVEGELLTRRNHCIAANVDISTPESSGIVRLLRSAGITRYRCVSDNPWAINIPQRGRIAPPYLAETDGGAP